MAFAQTSRIPRSRSTPVLSRLAGRVGHHYVGQPVGPLLDELAARVDRQHLVSQPLEVLGQCAAEPAEPDDEDRAGVDALSQRSVAPRVVGKAWVARAAPAPRPR